MINISVLEINISEIKKNLNNLKTKLKHNQKICFVAKANCYGFGEKLCKYIDRIVDYFAVSSGYEFFKIKDFVSKPILILDTIYDEKLLKILIKNGCELTVSNLKSFEVLLKIENEINEKIKIHLAVNTGMNRFGIDKISDFKKIINKLKKSQKIRLIGIFSHFFDGKSIKNAKNQINKFNIFYNYASKKYNNPIISHICSSDGAIFNNYGDMVRVGYAIYCDDKNETLKLKTKILDFQELNRGDTAGYNGIFVATKKTKLAIIGIGYGDGIFRNIVKKGYVLIDDKKSKIVAVCMDSMIVDVTKIKCRLNDDVIIIGKCKNNKISICDIATWCDTIGYEIISRFANRIDRIYIGEEECKLLQENTGQEN